MTIAANSQCDYRLNITYTRNQPGYIKNYPGGCYLPNLSIVRGTGVEPLNKNNVIQEFLTEFLLKNVQDHTFGHSQLMLQGS